MVKRVLWTVESIQIPLTFSFHCIIQLVHLFLHVLEFFFHPDWTLNSIRMIFPSTVLIFIALLFPILYSGWGIVAFLPQLLILPGQLFYTCNKGSDLLFHLVWRIKIHWKDKIFLQQVRALVLDMSSPQTAPNWWYLKSLVCYSSNRANVFFGCLQNKRENLVEKH